METIQHTSGAFLKKINKHSLRKISSGHHKLHSQYEWLKRNSHLNTSVHVKNFQRVGDFSSYDMEFLDGYEPLYKALQRRDNNILLTKVLDSIFDYAEKSQSLGQVSKNEVSLYIEKKLFLKHQEILELSPDLKKIASLPILYINDIKLLSLNTIMNSNLIESVINSLQGSNKYDIHGDLTAENIMIKKDIIKLIDPNNENEISDLNLEIAKLSQSLRFGYESLDRALISQYSKDRFQIDFQYIDGYSRAYQFFKQYVLEKKKLSYKKITIHEAIHFLRLLPYKISKGENELIYYLITVMLMNELLNE